MMEIKKCIRCEKEDITTIGRSPREGVWELYRCNVCQYIWRSTETNEVLTGIRLSPAEIADIPFVPPPTLTLPHAAE
jgi:hypothetical protein